VPAAGRAALTRLYDPVMALTMREDAWRPRLLRDVLDGLPPGARVIDVGCGTGTFALSLADERPDVEVIGVDGDAQALALAAAKPGAGRIDLRAGLAGSLPVEDASAERVVMSLLLHHLASGTRDAALAEALRVLRPGGRLHVADWGRPRGALARAAFLGVRLLDGLDNTRDHAAGRLAAIVAGAGFSQVASRGLVRTAWGTLELLSAARARGGPPQA
jgi:ubiquinone/menaquinone biosynthesis C-methylase UbiE